MHLESEKPHFTQEGMVCDCFSLVCRLAQSLQFPQYGALIAHGIAASFIVCTAAKTSTQLHALTQHALGWAFLLRVEQQPLNEAVFLQTIAPTLFLQSRILPSHRSSYS